MLGLYMECGSPYSSAMFSLVAFPHVMPPGSVTQSSRSVEILSRSGTGPFGRMSMPAIRQSDIWRESMSALNAANLTVSSRFSA